jgi:glycerol transport system substrate-binding protein
MLSKVWWPQISLAIKGDQTAKQTMDNIAARQDSILSKLKMAKFSPRLNKPKPESEWLNKSGAPKKRRGRDKPATIPYADLMQQWQ